MFVSIQHGSHFCKESLVPSKPLVQLLRSSADWVGKLPEGPEPLDVAGWSQPNFEAAWTEPISWAEFLNRLWKSEQMQELYQVDDAGNFTHEKETKEDGRA